MPMIDVYNEILGEIKEPGLTAREYESLSLPSAYSDFDVFNNLKQVILTRGVISNELSKLYLLAQSRGLDLGNATADRPAVSNLLFGGAV